MICKLNCKKGFFRIWIVVAIFWVGIILLLRFPTESFKSLKTSGISSLEYSREKDIKLINCILLSSKKKEGDDAATVNQKLDNIFSAPEYAKSIDISQEELKNAKVTEKDCADIDYKSISELKSKPSTKELIAEINRRIEDAKSKIWDFFLTLLSLPIGLFLLGIAVRYVYNGFKK